MKPHKYIATKLLNWVNNRLLLKNVEGLSQLRAQTVTKRGTFNVINWDEIASKFGKQNLHSF